MRNKARPPPPDEFATLRACVKELRLKGVDADVVFAICDGNGSVPIANLAVKFEWSNQADNWNSVRKRLDAKLKKHGWLFRTHNKCATAVPVPTGRK
jgi:hypothetical protein